MQDFSSKTLLLNSFKKGCICLFLAVLSSLLCRLSLVVVNGGYSLVVVRGPLIAVASLVAEHGL